jgi:tetratricopeptide (TPR) repeat protein
MMKEMKPQATITPFNSTRRILRYRIAVAATIVLVFLTFMAYDYFTLSSEKVFANNYQSYELTTFRDDEQSTAIDKAYKGKNYQEVISLQQTTAQNDIEANFLAGMSNLELNNNENAILNLKKVIDLNKTNGTNLWQDQAEFYLALVFLKNKDHDSSIELLQKIKDDPEHLYHEKVTARLLRQVNRLKRK